VVSPNLNCTDDAPAILNALSECCHGGHIILTNGTFHINTIINPTGLKNHYIDIHGYMLLSRYGALNDEEVQVGILLVVYAYHVLACKHHVLRLPGSKLGLVARRG